MERAPRLGHLRAGCLRGLAARVGHTQLGTALVDMNNVSFVLTWTLDAVMLGAAATVILHRAVLPRWLGWFAAVTAVLLIVSAPAADLVPPLGMLLGFLWIVATSVVLTRRTLRPRRHVAVATA